MPTGGVPSIAPQTWRRRLLKSELPAGLPWRPSQRAKTPQQYRPRAAKENGAQCRSSAPCKLWRLENSQKNENQWTSIEWLSFRTLLIALDRHAPQPTAEDCRQLSI